MNDYRRRTKVLRLKGQSKRWKKHKAYCDTDRGVHAIIQLGGGDFYSGLMHIDLVAAQVRVALRRFGEML